MPSADLNPANFVPANQKNFYEISWRFRRQVVADFLAENAEAELSEVLDHLEEFDMRYDCGLQSFKTAADSPLGEQHFFTGRVSVKDFDPEEVKANLAKPFRSKAYAEKIAEICEKFGYGPFDLIVELGAGYGLNLFRLAERQVVRSNRLAAAEITEAGRDLCAFLSALPSGPEIEVHPFDHREPDMSLVGTAHSVLVLTCHSIEQVTNLPADFFGRLAGAAPSVAAMHFEPFGFQTGRHSPAAGRHAEFIANKEFNQNFHEVLTGAESSGALTVRETVPEIFDHQPENPTSLAVWDNS